VPCSFQLSAFFKTKKITKTILSCIIKGFSAVLGNAGI